MKSFIFKFRNNFRIIGRKNKIAILKTREVSILIKIQQFLKIVLALALGIYVCLEGGMCADQRVSSYCGRYLLVSKCCVITARVKCSMLLVSGGGDDPRTTGEMRGGVKGEVRMMWSRWWSGRRRPTAE